MEIYIVLLILIFLLFMICYKKKSEILQNIYLIISGILLILISGLRNQIIGVDTPFYANFFKNIQTMSDLELNNHYYEKGFIEFNKILSLFSNNYMFLLFISSLIIILGILYFIKNNSKLLWLSLYLFVTLSFYYNSMNIMRQYMAMSLVLFSYNYVRKRKLVPFLLLVFLASTFHKTALVFLIVYFIPLIKLSYRKLYFSIFLSLIVYILLPNLLNLFFKYFKIYTGYTKYMESLNLGDAIKFIMLLLILLFGIIFKYPNFQKEKCVSINDKNLQTIIILMATIFSFLSIRMSILSRITDYFAIFTIVYIPNVLKTIHNLKLRLLITYIIVILCLIYNIIVFIYRPEWFMVTPYKFYWM